MADLHRKAFPLVQVARTIYISPKVDRYLAALAAFPELRKDHQLWGVWDSGILRGYAHFRALGASWHLNYIVVAPEYQGQGIGRALWTHWLEVGRQQGHHEVTLDVEQENQQAIEWYRRRGLQVAEAMWIYERAIGPASTSASDSATIRLLDWEQAEAWQQAYGFSQFRLACDKGTWTVGRLGESVFRTQQQLLPMVESTLARIDPSRHLLFLAPQPLDTPSSTQIGVSLHMKGGI